MAITEQVADVRSIRANLTAGSTVNRLRNLGSTAADNTGKYARFGLVMQQAGYQVQDFAVQVAGGQNKLVAFSQQGAQLLGFFGVGGAIAGAVLSTGVLIARMAGLGDETKKVTATVSEAEDAWKNYSKTLNDITFGNAKPEKKVSILEKQIESSKNDIKLLSDLQARFQLLSTGLATDAVGTAISAQFSEGKNVIFDTLEKNLKWQKALNDARQKGSAIPDKYAEQFGGLFSGAESIGIGNFLARKKDIDTVLTEASKLGGEKSKELILSLDQVRDLNEIIAEEKKKQETEAWNDAAKSQQEDLRQRIEAGNRVFMMEQESADQRKKEAESIRDQIDPMRIKVREQERYNELVKKGQLTQAELDTLNKMRIEKTVVGLQSKVPESLGLNQGALSSGLLVGGASPSALIDISQQILAGIRQLVNIEYMGQRSY